MPLPGRQQRSARPTRAASSRKTVPSQTNQPTYESYGPSQFMQPGHRNEQFQARNSSESSGFEGMVFCDDSGVHPDETYELATDIIEDGIELAPPAPKKKELINCESRCVRNRIANVVKTQANNTGKYTTRHGAFMDPRNCPALNCQIEFLYARGFSNLYRNQQGGNASTTVPFRPDKNPRVAQTSNQGDAVSHDRSQEGPAEPQPVNGTSRSEFPSSAEIQFDTALPNPQGDSNIREPVVLLFDRSESHEPDVNRGHPAHKHEEKHKKAVPARPGTRNGPAKVTKKKPTSTAAKKTSTTKHQTAKNSMAVPDNSVGRRSQRTRTKLANKNSPKADKPPQDGMKSLAPVQAELNKTLGPASSGASPVTSCAICGITKTSAWRKHTDGSTICNACKSYWYRHKKNRPQKLWSHVK